MADETNYNDPTGLEKIDYDQEQVSPEVKKHTKNVRHKMYGRHVRESIARAIEVIDLTAQSALNFAKKAFSKSEDTENRLDNQIRDLTSDSEIIDLRYSKMLKKNFNILKERGDFWDDEIELRGIRPEWFGFIGDGTKEDLARLQATVDYAASKGIPKIRFTKRHYYIYSHLDKYPYTIPYLMNNGGVIVRDDIEFVLSPNTVLEAVSNSEQAYNMFTVYNNKNVIFRNGEMKGDVKKHTGTAGEYGFGIACQGSRNVKVFDMLFTDFWGDGIDVNRCFKEDNPERYWSEDIHLERCVFKNNSRQGVSIEEVNRMRLINCDFLGSFRKAPGAGIDIEPGWRQEHDKPICKNIFIDGCNFIDNAGPGITMWGVGVGHVIITNSNFEGNGKGAGQFRNAGLRISTVHDVVISNCDFGDEQHILLSGIDGLKMDNNKFRNLNIHIQYTLKNARFTNNEHIHTYNKEGIHSFYIEQGAGLINDLIIEGNLFRNYVDKFIDDTLYGVISAIEVKNVSALFIKNNVFEGYHYHVRNTHYNNYEYTNLVQMVGNEHYSSKRPAITSVAFNLLIKDSHFGGCSYLTKDNRRDIGINMVTDDVSHAIFNNTGRTVGIDKELKGNYSGPKAVMVFTWGPGTKGLLNGKGNKATYDISNSIDMLSFEKASISQTPAETYVVETLPPTVIHPGGSIIFNKRDGKVYTVHPVELKYKALI